MRVGSRHEQAIAKDAEATVDGAAAQVHVLRELAAVMPDLPPRSRIDRPGVVVEASHVQHAVDHERRRVKAALCTGLERPLRGQLMDVFRRDLREGAVAMAEAIAGVRQPPRRILEAVEQILRCDLRPAALLRGERGGASGDDRHYQHARSTHVQLPRPT